MCQVTVMAEIGGVTPKHPSLQDRRVQLVFLLILLILAACTARRWTALAWAGLI